MMAAVVVPLLWPWFLVNLAQLSRRRKLPEF
jgi:uncharacterized protein (TIGR03382 family)